MYEDFTVTDRWTAEPLHCVWKGTIVAIATRHADSTDIRFAVNGRPVWIALQHRLGRAEAPHRKRHHRRARRTDRRPLSQAGHRVRLR
jgi:hypothetical protein